jgi:hypothetical protein
MKNLINKETQTIILKQIVSEIFDVDILDKRRIRNVVDARGVYSKILKDKGFTLVFIGQSLNKDHSTIINCLNNTEFFIEHDNNIKQKYYICLSRFHQALGITELDTLSDLSEYQLKKEIIKLRLELRDLADSYDELSNKYTIDAKKHSKYEYIYQMISTRCKDSYLYMVERKVNQILNTLHQ